MKKRKRKALFKHEGYIAIEFFGLKKEKKEYFLDFLSQSKFIVSASITENGEGVFIVEVNPIPKNHKEHIRAFNAAVQALKEIAKAFDLTTRELTESTEFIAKKVQVHQEGEEPKKGFIWKSSSEDSPFHIKNIKDRV